MTLQGVLELFGADILDARPAIELVFAWLHLIGVLAFLAALGLALARFFRAADLLVPAFAAAILINVASYLFSLHAVDLLGAREIAAVLPLGAVLTGRLLGEPLLGALRGGRPARAWLLPVLGVTVAGLRWPRWPTGPCSRRPRPPTRGWPPGWPRAG